MNAVSYELELAKKRVNDFKDVSDELTRDHLDAMQCLDCQEVLEKGIRAFESLKRAEDVLREAAREGIAVPDDVIEAIELLYRIWLAPCGMVEQWIEQLAIRDYRPDNLDAFHEASRQVRTALAVIDSHAAIDAVSTEGF